MNEMAEPWWYPRVLLTLTSNQDGRDIDQKHNQSWLQCSSRIQETLPEARCYPSLLDSGSSQEELGVDLGHLGGTTKAPERTQG